MNMHISAASVGSVQTRAMLAGLKISAWAGRKLDKDVTRKAVDDHHAASDAGRFNKALLDPKAFAGVNAVISKARKEHYARTLPWHDDGARILSAAGYLDYTGAMRTIRAEFETEVAAFVAAYDGHVSATQRRLGDMFDASEYPSANEIRRRFGFDIVVSNMPDAADFRVAIGDDVAAMIRADMTERHAQTMREAMGDVFARVCESVGNMATKLTAERTAKNGDKVAAIFHESLVENVRELVRLLPSLNVTGDAMLSKLAERMQADLCQFDAKELRDNASARQSVAKAAESILADASDYLA